MWLIIAGVMFVGEILTTGFLLFWIGIAALAAMLTALIGLGLYFQVPVFIAVSAVLIIFTKPIVDKALKPRMIPTNVSALKGRKAVVIQQINNILGIGQVKSGGEVWSAQGFEGQNIEEGSEVEIIDIQGVKAIVRPVQNSNIKEEVTK
jgi:membrane protein implicated in regulation of membrane protease activity